MASGAIGVVLAGGRGRRLDGDKAGVLLGGRPLAAWVAQALGVILSNVVVVIRADSATLPSLDVPIWREPAGGAPPHPLTGLAFALGRAGGRDVLCCPVDLPFVSPVTLSVLLEAPRAGGPGSVAVAAGQPLLGRFPAGCAASLSTAARAGASVRATVASLSPVVVDVPESELLNVNTPADLARAEAVASARPPRS